MAAIQVTTIKNALHTWIRTASGLPADRILWAGQNAPEPPGTDQAWILLGRMTWTNPGNDWSQFAPNPLTFSPKTVTLDATTDQGSSTGHQLTTRSGPIHLVTTGSLAGTNLATATNYWIIATGPDTVKFAASFQDADTGVFIDIQGAGTGTHTIVYTPDTRTAGAELIEYVRGARRVSFDVQCFPAQPVPPAILADTDEAYSILSDVAAKCWLGSIYGPLSDAGIGVIDSGQPQSIDGVLNAVYFEPRAIMTVVFATTSEVQGTETIIDFVNFDGTEDAPTFVLDDTVPPNKP